MWRTLKASFRCFVSSTTVFRSRSLLSPLRYPEIETGHQTQSPFKRRTHSIAVLQAHRFLKRCALINASAAEFCFSRPFYSCTPETGYSSFSFTVSTPISWCSLSYTADWTWRSSPFISSTSTLQYAEFF